MKELNHMNKQQVTTSIGPLFSDCREVILAAMNAESAARNAWVTLATKLHDKGVMALHLVQSTEKNENIAFKPAVYAELSAIICSGLAKHLSAVMLNKKGELVSKADCVEGQNRTNWDAGNDLRKGYFSKIREYLRKAEAEEKDGAKSSARNLKKLVDETLRELMATIAKMPVKRQDANPHDVGAILEVARKSVAACK